MTLTKFIFSLLLFTILSVSAQTSVEVTEAEYPRTIQTDQGTIVVHHPQIESWENFEALRGWLPVEATAAGSDSTWIGSALLEAQTDIDFDERLVVLHDINVIDKKFPDGEPPEDIMQLVRDNISLQPRSVVLDVLIRALPEDFEVPGSGEAPAGFNSAPPKIFVSQTPAALMVINGEPVKVAIEGTKLEYVVNTNWDLFWDTKKSRWYVLNDKAWQRSDVLVGAVWETTKKLPRDFKKLPEEKNWDAAHTALPASKPEQEPPRILVSNEPAELILLDGAPETESIGDTGISFVTNTGSDLFGHDGNYYYLVSGRWFTAQSLSADWNPADPLPDAFASIPSDHEKAHVRISIPGTDEARVALIEAQIPRTADISKEAGKDLVVYYAGDPQFVAVEGTSLQRAANTSNQVIAYDGGYYLCYNAAWFSSTTPEGPWQLTADVPDEIYKIPPSDPAYNVTYVYVVDKEEPEKATSSSTVHTHISFGYSMGYYGVYPYYSVVYGTGWYYNPWVYYPPYGYPYYYHYPHSYGYGAWYNPVRGTYGQRSVAYGPYGGAGTTAIYNPRTGGYARGWSAWDNDEVARSGYGYNPRSNTFAAGNMYYDFDDNSGWREGYVQRGDNWVYGETRIDGNTRTTDFETARGVQGTSRREFDDGVMTGTGTLQRDGRSAQTQSRIDAEGAQISAQGSRGGNVDISQERGSTTREISGNTGTGVGFEGESQRTVGGGRQTELSTDAGGQARLSRNDGNRTAVGQTAGGDVYAGRNGNVYKRSDSGWSSYDNGSWNSVNRGSSTSRSSQFQRDAGNLNRQYNARSRGYSNHSQYRSQMSSRSGSMNRTRSAGRRWR